MILRPGAITREMLESVVGPVAVEPSVARGLAIDPKDHPRSPGMKYRHYAPQGTMVLLRGSMEKTAAYMWDRIQKEPVRTGWLVSEELEQIIEKNGPIPETVHMECLGSRNDPEEMSHRLFAALRRFDQEGCRTIYGEAFSDTGREMALMNRLRRACAGHIISIE